MTRYLPGPGGNAMPTTSLKFSSVPFSSHRRADGRAVGGRRPPSAQNFTPSKRAGALTLAAMSLGFAVVQLDVTIVNTALNSIGAALGGGVAELQWVVNAYTIAFAAFILTAGARGDRIGAKRVFMAGFAIFIAASLAFAPPPHPGPVLPARAGGG